MEPVTDPELIARLSEKMLQQQMSSELREADQPETFFETAAPWLLGSVTLLALILMYALIKYVKRKRVAIGRKWLIFTLTVASLPGYLFLLANRGSDWGIVFVFSLPLIVYLTYIASDLLGRWITKQKNIND